LGWIKRHAANDGSFRIRGLRWRKSPHRKTAEHRLILAPVSGPNGMLEPVMPGHYHAVVWIDHREARVFHFDRHDAERLVIHPHNPTRHIHHKANSIGSGHASEDQDFLHAVTQAIADAGSVLIAGPANAKTELVKHIHRHDPRLIERITGIESVDHPTDGALVDYARRYLAAADRLRV
jgi:hypothetical protein